MAFSTGYSSASWAEIRESIDEVQLAAKYLGITKIPCLINSPLRRDSKPSFGLYLKDGQRIGWTDFATKESGGIYDLLSLIWKCDFKDTVRRIIKDVGLYKEININKSCKRVKVDRSNDTELKCKVRQWKQHDIDYWASYGISLKWLKYAEVYPISHKIIVKQGKQYVLGADKYAYAYVERKEGKVTLKIYQPFNKNGYKWSNKHDRSVISLWTKIPEKGDKLVICSSLKDALCLWANTGVPALAIQGEGYGMSDTAVNELKRRYKSIFVLLDNDTAGLVDGQKLSESTGFTNLVLPPFEGGKDVSDLYKVKGLEVFKTIINNLLDIDTSETSSH